MTNNHKQELIQRLSMVALLVRSLDALTLELVATINIGDNDFEPIVENGLTMLQRAAEHLRYFQSLAETYNAGRNPS